MKQGKKIYILNMYRKREKKGIESEQVYLYNKMEI